MVPSLLSLDYDDIAPIFLDRREGAVPADDDPVFRSSGTCCRIKTHAERAAMLGPAGRPARVNRCMIFPSRMGSTILPAA